MINLKRRARQANENSDIIFTKFIEKVINREYIFENVEHVKIDSEEKIIKLLDALEEIVVSTAKTIEPDWAIPIIIEIIGKIYYGDYCNYKSYGNSFKRALAYLWKDLFNLHGTKKNINQLIELIYQCYILEGVCSYQKMFWAVNDFNFNFDKGRIIIPQKFIECCHDFQYMIRGRGKRLRVSEINTKLMLETSEEYMDSLISVLTGTHPSKITIFKNTFFEKIPSVNNNAGKLFWQELFCRYVFFTTISLQTKHPYEVFLFHEFAIDGIPDFLFTQEIIENLFWKSEWFFKQPREKYSNLIVEKPIIRISENGDFAVSAVLIGDSINKFIEKSIRENDEVFKLAISEPFEQKCIDFFRGMGFEAGHVTTKGTWKTQSSTINMCIPQEKNPGEIDVLAYRDDLELLFLIECKVLKDVEDTESYKSLVSKLKNDNEGFKAKLIKKSEWIKKSFSINFNKDIEIVSVLLTDIPLPILNLNDDNVIYTNFHDIQNILPNLLDRFI